MTHYKLNIHEKGIEKNTSQNKHNETKWIDKKKGKIIDKTVSEN